jgi:hypothetical protein
VILSARKNTVSSVIENLLSDGSNDAIVKVARRKGSCDTIAPGAGTVGALVGELDTRFTYTVLAVGADVILRHR